MKVQEVVNAFGANKVSEIGEFVLPARQNDGMSEASLGPLPISECYFAGEGHTGMAAGKGCILVLHIPTLDVWSLSPFGCGRSLLLARLINGKMIPAHLEDRVEALYSQATRNCGGQLTSEHPESGIVPKDLSRRNLSPVGKLLCPPRELT